jgi:hypothetical protein
MNNTGIKNDESKLRWDLVQPHALQEYVRVLTKGAAKYSPDNWRKVANFKNRYFAAALRHVWSWWLGERNDAEFGTHHLSNAICCLAFLLEREIEDQQSDRADRPGWTYDIEVYPEGYSSLEHLADVYANSYGGWTAEPFRDRPKSIQHFTDRTSAFEYCEKYARMLKSNHEYNDDPRRVRIPDSTSPAGSCGQPSTDGDAGPMVATDRK